MVEKIYRAAEPITYAVLRLLFGVILLTHGLPKLTRTSHGVVADPFNSVMHLVQMKLHWPIAIFFAFCVTLIETAGALCLAVGFLTRIAAPMIAVEMAVICLIEFPVFNWLDHGMEYALLMGTLALYISMRGGGPFSIDQVLNRPKWLMGSAHAAGW